MAIEEYCPAPCWMRISAQWAESTSSMTAGAYFKLNFCPKKARLRNNNVPVRNVRCTIDEGSDAPTKCEQTCVDVACLPGTFVHCTRPTNVLTSSKIYLCVYVSRKERYWNHKIR